MMRWCDDDAAADDDDDHDADHDADADDGDDDDDDDHDDCKCGATSGLGRTCLLNSLATDRNWDVHRSSGDYDIVLTSSCHQFWAVSAKSHKNKQSKTNNSRILWVMLTS